MGILIGLLVRGLAVLLAAYVIPGVTVESFFTAIVVGVFISIVNIFIKPLLTILTLPLTILTLGLFTFVLNALLILLVARIVPGFHVADFWAAMWFGIVLSLVQFFLNRLV